MPAKNVLKSKRIFYLICVLFFSLWLWIAINLPYIGDDLNWGIKAGIDHLITHDINTRYAGNFIVVLLTRSSLLKSVVLGLVYFLIPFMSLKILELFVKLDYTDKSACFCFINVLYLAVSYEIWKQTFGWVSGAVNFVISVLLLLIYVYCIVASLTGKKSRLMLYSSFFLGLIMQLFIENIAVYALLVTVAVFGYKLHKERKVDATLLLILIGNIIGVLIVFNNTVVSVLFKTGSAVDGYRKTIYTTSASFFEKVKLIVVNYFYIIMPSVYVRMNSLYSVAILLFLCGISIRNKAKNTRIYVAVNSILIVILLIDYCSFQSFNERALTVDEIENFRNLAKAETFISLAVVLVGMIELKKILFDKNKKLISLFVEFLWFSPWLLLAPLSIINESGFRLFLTTDAFIILLASYLFVTLTNDLKPRIALISRIITGIIATVFFVKWTVIYSSIGLCTKRRLAAIENARQEHSESLVLEGYEYDRYLHGANPSDETRLTDFREFFDIPGNVVIVFE